MWLQWSREVWSDAGGVNLVDEWEGTCWLVIGSKIKKSLSIYWPVTATRPHAHIQEFIKTKKQLVHKPNLEGRGYFNPSPQASLNVHLQLIKGPWPVSLFLKYYSKKAPRNFVKKNLENDEFFKEKLISSSNVIPKNKVIWGNTLSSWSANLFLGIVLS